MHNRILQCADTMLVPILVWSGVFSCPVMAAHLHSNLHSAAAFAGARPCSEVHGCACRQPRCVGKLPPSQLPQSVQVPADDTASYGGWT